MQHNIRVPGLWRMREIKQEPAENRRILEAFWNDRVINRNQDAISSLQGMLKHNYPEACKIFDEAISNLDLNKFLELSNAPKILASHAIRSIDGYEDLGVIASGLPENVAEVKIKGADWQELHAYALDKKISASVAIATSSQQIGSDIGKMTVGQDQFDVDAALSIHSVGKVPTGVLALIMIQNGILSEDQLKSSVYDQLDDNVKSTLTIEVTNHLKNVTLHQAMTHMAGLGNNNSNADYLRRYAKVLSEAIKNKGTGPEMNKISDFLHFAFPKRYTLQLLSEKERNSNTLYVESTPEGMVYEVIGLDNKLKRGFLAWQLFPANFSHDITKIIAGSEKTLPEILKLTEKNGHTTEPFKPGEIGKRDYSNIGILLVGLVIENAYKQYCKQYSEKHPEEKLEPLDFNGILKKYIIDEAKMSDMAPHKPDNAKFNEGSIDHYVIGSPAGGSWTNVENLAKFGQWLYKKCTNDKQFMALVDQYGGEFYKNGMIYHKGDVRTGSSYLSVSLKTGRVVTALNAQRDNAAAEIGYAVKRNIFSISANQLSLFSTDKMQRKREIKNAFPNKFKR